MSFFPGIQIADRYELEAELGDPGGQTYRARDTHTDRRVALKIFTAEHGGPDVDAWLRRIVQEAQALASIHHPNVAAVLDAQAMGPDSLFVVEELLEGHTLADELELAGALPAPRAQAVLLGVLDGLEELHRRGLVHRNLKPSSVMIAQHGDAPKLMDVGLCRPQPSEGRGPFVSGTLPYLAPEQLRGALVDPRTDVYGVGLLAFELLAGRPAFTAEEARARRAGDASMKPPALSTAASAAPITMSAMVARATLPEPAERFDGIASQRAALVGRLPRRPSTVDAPLLRPDASREAVAAATMPDPFAPVKEALGAAESVLPPGLGMRKLVPAVAVVAVVAFALTAWWGRLGSASAMHEIVAAVGPCAQAQPKALSMAYLVGRGGAVTTLANSPCNDLPTLSSARHPTLVMLTTGPNGVTSAVAYRVKLDWSVATADSGVPEGDLEDQLDGVGEDAAVCLARVPVNLVAGDRGDFIPINFHFDDGGRVKRVVAGYNYVNGTGHRWQGTVPEVACLGKVAERVALPPIGGAGGGANTKVTYSTAEIARWP